MLGGEGLIAFARYASGSEDEDEDTVIAAARLLAETLSMFRLSVSNGKIK